MRLDTRVFANQICIIQIKEYFDLILSKKVFEKKEKISKYGSRSIGF